jgi:hypothetical protein
MATYSKSDMLMLSLTEFYKKKSHLKKMARIASGSDRISLRILDWFVTNYSKKNNTIYDIHYGPEYDENNVNRFNVYLDYKSQLKAYTKKQFDPFCRNRRILFKTHDGDELNTTVGQLNFFRWAIENRVIDYIEDHIDEIESDMNIVGKIAYPPVSKKVKIITNIGNGKGEKGEKGEKEE